MQIQAIILRNTLFLLLPLLSHCSVDHLLAHADHSNPEDDLVQPDEAHLPGVPRFLKQPEPRLYTRSGHPAMVECLAEPVNHASIVCAGTPNSYKGSGDTTSRLRVKRFDAEGKPSQKGQRWHFQMAVKIDDVEEFFDTYTCHCEAWNRIPKLDRPKKVKSNQTTISEVCKFRNLLLTSLLVYWHACMRLRKVCKEQYPRFSHLN